MNKKLLKRRATCEQCIAACEQCLAILAAEAAERAGEKTSSQRREIFHACVRICTLVVEEIRLNSAFLSQVCGLCAVLCRACREECQQYRGEQFEFCAQACERAAQECRALALNA